jgi:benzoylformate decarboxylase
MRGRKVFFDSLVLHGVDKIFGNPGTTESPLVDNLMDYPEIEYIVALHEGITVGAAGFYAQATGKTTVANMHVAPGLGNAIGMIYGALKANSPVIVTAGQQDTRLRLRDPLLGHDLVAMAAPVTKWSVQVNHADEMGPIMQRAFKIANEHPAGPVFVALPIDVMEQETEVAATRAGEITAQGVASEAALAHLAELIRGSDRPGIVASDDVARSGALVAFAEAIGAGVHTELLASHIIFPTAHPHYRGRLGADAAAIHHALRDYDLVILVGGPFFEEVWYSGQPPFPPGAAIVQLEQSAGRMAYNYPLSLGVIGDIADMLPRLTRLVGVKPAWQERCEIMQRLKQEENDNVAARFAALANRSPMAPVHALHALAQALPDDVVVVDESITGMGDVTQSFRPAKMHDYYAGRGGGIGQGIAGAIGTAVAHRDRPVVAISGDGSAMYSIPSLWTAAHHHLNLLFVILSNREYRVLKHNVDAYRQRFDAPSNNPYAHMDLTDPVLDFVDMAKGMGVPGRQVTEPGEIKAAVDAAMSTPGPYLIDLVVEGK